MNKPLFKDKYPNINLNTFGGIVWEFSYNSNNDLFEENLPYIYKLLHEYHIIVLIYKLKKLNLIDKYWFFYPLNTREFNKEFRPFSGETIFYNGKDYIIMSHPFVSIILGDKYIKDKEARRNYINYILKVKYWSERARPFIDLKAIYIQKDVTEEKRQEISNELIDNWFFYFYKDYENIEVKDKELIIEALKEYSEYISIKKVDEITKKCLNYLYKKMKGKKLPKATKKKEKFIKIFLENRNRA
jgi:hypothetical protein